MKNASNPQIFRDPDEQWSVFDINYLPGWRLRDVQCQPKDVGVGLVEVNEAGGNKKIHKPIQLEFANPIRVQFARFVAHHGDLQSILCLDFAEQLDHLRMRLRLREHEAPKLSTGERSFLEEDHPIQIFFQRELSILVSGEVQLMPIFHLRPRQLEAFRRPSAGMMIPPVGEQHAAYIHKHAGDCSRSLRCIFFCRVDHRCQRIRASSSGIATPSQCGITRAVYSAGGRAAGTVAL